MTARSGARGFTLVELLCVCFLLVILAGVALPVVHVMHRRAKELELKQDLRSMRRAIDAYNWTIRKVPSAAEDLVAEGWPEELEILVEGIDLGLAKDIKVKFLRRIPTDPITGEAEWGMRSNKQDPDDDMWDGQNVYDVFSLAEGDGLDGVPYREW